MDEALCIGLRGVYKDWQPMIDVRGRFRTLKITQDLTWSRWTTQWALA